MFDYFSRILLDFERKQTTAPHKLTNPAGHYRRAVQKFYETRTKRRDWDIREQMRVLEAKIGLAHDPAERPTCPLSRCNSTGEVYDSAGLVSACECTLGQQLSPKVLALFDQINAHRKVQDGMRVDQEVCDGLKNYLHA